MKPTTFLRDFLRDYGIAILVITLSIVLQIHFTFFRSRIPDLQGVIRRIWDFYVYYDAGKFALLRQGDLYDLNHITLGFVNLPIVAYLFAPFAIFSREQAEVVYFLFSILSVFLTGFFLIKVTNVSGWKRTALIVLLALSHPLFNTVKLGNSSQFTFLILVILFSAYQSRRYLLVGGLITFAGLIKIPVFFILLYFLIRRKWAVVTSCLITLFLAIAASIVFFGLDLNLIWLQSCVISFAGKAIPAYNIQSVSGFVSRLLLNVPIADLTISWTPITPDWRYKLIHNLAIFFLVGSSVWICLLSKTSLPAPQLESIEFSIFLTLAILISPISWTHYYTFLLLPAALCLSGYLPLPQKRFYLIATICSLLVTQIPSLYGLFSLIIPVYKITSHPFQSVILDFLFNLVVSSYFVAGLVFLGMLLITRRYSFHTIHD